MVRQDVGVNVELIVSVSSAFLSIIAGLLSARASTKAQKFEFELEQRKKQEDAAAMAERILHLYRDPLIDAAHTLQGRFYNVIGKSYLTKFYVNKTDEEQRRYARDYTVYAIAEYLTWAEILRRELRFTDSGDTKRSRDLMEKLASIQYAFQRDDIPHQFEIFRGRQRAIAEVMMVPTNAPEGPRTEPMGYAAFCRRLAEDKDFAGWFTQLQQDVDTVARATDQENVRLIYVQQELIDLIDFLDDKRVRIPENTRRRLPDPTPPAVIPAQPTRG
jgi:hypothetical protein